MLWRKFYPRDFLADPALGGCTLQATGLWIKLLCLIWEHDSGDGSITMTVENLARRCGCKRLELVESLEELASAGVGAVEWFRVGSSVTNALEPVDKSVHNGEDGAISDEFVTDVTQGQTIAVTIHSRRISREGTTRDKTRLRVRKHRELAKALQKNLKDM